MRRSAFAFVFALLIGSAAQAAGTVSALPLASQPLGTLPDAVLLDQGTGCPTATAPCTTSQSPSLRVGQPFQGTSPPSPPFIFQLWWNTSTTPKTLEIYDGSQWVIFGTLNPLTHTWNGVSPVLSSTLPGYGFGCTLSNNGITPNTTINIAACLTADDVNFSAMQAVVGYTKILTTWAVGSGTGCLDTGTVGSSTWYYLFQIMRSDTGVVDYLCSASLSAPTIPTSYAAKRFIGAILTDASANILAFTQVGNEFLWKSPTRDVAAVTCTTTAASVALADVPTGYRVQANLRASIVKAVDAPILLLSSLDEIDNAPGTPAGNYTVIANVIGVTSAGPVRVSTNATQQIRQRCSVTGATLNVVTVGWVDPQIAWQH